MKLICPNCETSYEISAAAMPSEGRQVRCARCGNRWHATPQDEPETATAEPEIAAVATAPAPVEAPDPAEPEAATPVETETATPLQEAAPVPAEEEPAAVVPEKAAPAPVRDPRAQLVTAEMIDDPDGELPPFDDPDDEPSGPTPESVEAAAVRAARRVRIHRKSKGQSASHTLYGFAIGATLAMTVLAVQYRENVVRSMPQAAAIYRTLGMDVNIRGLRFEALAPQRTVEDGVPTLVVEGKILNIRNEDTEVPALHFVLRDGAGDELYNWTIEPLQRTLERRGELPFRTRLASPPADADAVELRFVDRNLKQVGMRP